MGLPTDDNHVGYLDDRLAPVLRLYMDGQPAEQTFVDAVMDLTYEDTVDLVSEMRLTLKDDRLLSLTNSPWLDPGVPIDVFIGYGARRQVFVGRGEVCQHEPAFGDDGSVILQVTARDRSYQMMQEGLRLKEKRQIGKRGKQTLLGVAIESREPRMSKFPRRYAVAPGMTPIDVTGKRKPIRLRGHRRSGGATRGGQTGQLYDGTLGEVITTICYRYDVQPKIDDKLANVKVRKFVQEKGTSDYTILMQLANIYGAHFVVWYDHQTSAWIGSFMRPESLKNYQPLKHVLLWNASGPEAEKSGVANVRFTMAIDPGANEYQAWIFNPAAKEWELVAGEDDPDGQGEVVPDGRSYVVGAASAIGNEQATTGRSYVKIAYGGYTVSVLPLKTLDKDMAREFAKSWIERYRESFILAEGTLAGLPTIRAGDVHYFKEFGPRYSGLYYFSEVRHTYGDGGYLVNFKARRMIGS